MNTNKRHRPLAAIIYHYYAEIVSRITVDQDRRPLPPIPCEFCGQTTHKTEYCPNYEQMGFLDNGKDKEHQCD
jgi:hypothetical protein